MSRFKKTNINKVKVEKGVKTAKNGKEIALHIATLLLAIYTIFRIVSSVSYMVSYMSAYGMNATSNITILLTYVVGQALPYVLFTVLFFLYARMYKRFSALEKTSHTNISLELDKDIHKASVLEEPESKSFEETSEMTENNFEENAVMPEDSTERDESKDDEIDSANEMETGEQNSGRLTLLPDEDAD